MENVQKTPEQWFQMLKEPYRSEAIANIQSELIKNYFESIIEALYSSFIWTDTPQNYKYWIDIFNSIEAGETTYLEPELIGNTDNLKPEQMESGKWYVIEVGYLWLIKFKNINNQDVNVFKSISICTDSFVKYKYEDFCQCKIQQIKSIRPATKEEVLKYFPDEKFENVSLINEVNNTQVTEQQNQIEPEKVEVDWKAKFEELQKRYEVLVTESHKLDVLSGEMCDKYTDLKKDYENLHFTYKELMKIHEEQDLAYDALADKYSKLEAYNDELTEKINETETKNNQEKVYFYLDKERNHWRLNIDKQIAIDDSENHKEIYESVKIGVKKSVLVNE